MRIGDRTFRGLVALLLGVSLLSWAALAGAAKPKTKPKAGPIGGEEIGSRSGARVDLVFLIDTTGSMWDELDTAKDVALATLEHYTKSDPPTDLRVGVIAYRDKGEDPSTSYVVQRWELDADLAAARKYIWELTPKGGGDRPEDIGLALKIAINDQPWDMDKNTARNIVILGDAPLKKYPGDPDVKKLAELAKKKVIIINTVSIGSASDTVESFRAIAEAGGGSFEVRKPAAPRPGAPPRPDVGGRRDVVFVIDTTGSMGGTIETVKTKVRGMARALTEGEGSGDMQEALAVRFGLVDYRDKGDEWRVKKFDFTSDIKEFLKDLETFYASGGGDWEESSNLALTVAIRDFSWDPSAGKAIVLIGDAPPHEYPGEWDHVTVSHHAKKKGIVINTVACSGGEEAKYWKRISDITGGDFYMLSGLGEAIDHTVGP